MRFSAVRLASLGYALPESAVPSEELERRLAPLYGRLGLSVGRLELMSGVRERRFWPSGTRPSEVAAVAGERALVSTGVARERIGCLVHAGVCRDFMEPATAAFVHRRLGLARSCEFFDVSNACLGFANAMALCASRIEAGEIESALVVAGEDGGPLVEQTLRALLADPVVGKRELKRAFASLTIGSGAAAAVLCRADTPGLAASAPELLGAVARVASEHSELCQGDRTATGEGPLMVTDSEALLEAGLSLAVETFAEFLREMEWTRADVERVITHQVGSAHRRLLLERLELAADIDFPTFETLGNIGSVSLPLSLAMAIEAGKVRPGQRVALMGIGSGLSAQILGLRA